MAAGELVDDALVEAIVRQRLQDHDWNYGFIIDGFPRNVRQAEFFLESYDLDAVILLDLPDDEVAARVLARRICAGCGLDYNVIGRRPDESEICATCGGQLVTREDDNPEALAARLHDYHAKTATDHRTVRAQRERVANRRQPGVPGRPGRDPPQARAVTRDPLVVG